MSPSTIMGINHLPDVQKREIYARLIPHQLMSRFNLNTEFIDAEGRQLLLLRCNDGSPSLEMSLKHQADFPDPILYGHLTDTITGYIHILLYILNDPESPRFDVDRMPDGRPTVFGTQFRNLPAELAAMEAGLAPGQIRRGMRMLWDAILGFEIFISSLEQVIFFAEPLYYHTAVLFERYGFAYQKGRKLMERIQSGFSPGGDLFRRLDQSTPFRGFEAGNGVRLRSWAIHDGILGEPFTDVTMYKQVGKSANIDTSNDCPW
jgi:hypothetical protein